jgi:DNA-directed RNA polymerase specialized sigma24 family protein
MEELVKYVKALVFLQAQSLNANEAPVKPELLLSRAGLKNAEIALILDKTEAAVAKSIQRAK